MKTFKASTQKQLKLCNHFWEFLLDPYFAICHTKNIKQAYDGTESAMWGVIDCLSILSSKEKYNLHPRGLALSQFRPQTFNCYIWTPEVYKWKLNC